MGVNLLDNKELGENQPLVFMTGGHKSVSKPWSFFHPSSREFYKWDRHAFWPPKNPPLYSRKYECNYHFVQATFFCEDSSTRKKKTAAILQRPGQFQKLFIFSGQKILGTVYKLRHLKFKMAMTENSWVLPLQLTIYWINWQL